MIVKKKGKLALARKLGLSISSLYYIPRQPEKDWALKIRIGKVLQEQPSYGYRRVALALNINKKRSQRVMRIFGIRPYRRRGRRPKKSGVSGAAQYPNLLRETMSMYKNHIWAADFTFLPFKKKFVYLATVVDLFTREVLGEAVSTHHDVSLVLEAFFSALHQCPRPFIFHSDNGAVSTAQGYLRERSLIWASESREAGKARLGRTAIRNHSILSSKSTWEILTGSRRLGSLSTKSIDLSMPIMRTASTLPSGCRRKSLPSAAKRL